jgi:hypothetical protein
MRSPERKGAISLGKQRVRRHNKTPQRVRALVGIGATCRQIKTMLYMLEKEIRAIARRTRERIYYLATCDRPVPSLFCRSRFVQLDTPHVSVFCRRFVCKGRMQFITNKTTFPVVTCADELNFRTTHGSHTFQVTFCFGCRISVWTKA